MFCKDNWIVCSTFVYSKDDFANRSVGQNGPVNLEIFPPPKIVEFITRFYNAIVHKYEQDEPFANMPEIA